MKILIILLPFKQHFYHRFDSLFKKEKFRSVEIFSLQQSVLNRYKKNFYQNINSLSFQETIKLNFLDMEHIKTLQRN